MSRAFYKLFNAQLFSLDNKKPPYGGLELIVYLIDEIALI